MSNHLVLSASSEDEEPGESPPAATVPVSAEDPELDAERADLDAEGEEVGALDCRAEGDPEGGSILIDADEDADGDTAADPAEEGEELDEAVPLVELQPAMSRAAPIAAAVRV